MAERDWYRVVLDGPCPECGFDATVIPRPDLGGAVVGEAASWGALLARASGQLRRRPADGSWTALEYACHTRDVIGVFATRIDQALRDDRPVFGWWDHEAAAVDEAYDDQEPREVSAELRRRAEVFRAVLASVDEAGWDRTGTRRPGEEFSVDGLARFALHEAHHHRLDAEAAAGP